MAKRTSNKQGGNNPPQKKSFPANKLKDRVRKHIHDINDIITDDDIRNSNLNSTEIQKEVEKKEEELKENAKVNEGNVVEGGKKSITPWDVLNE